MARPVSIRWSLLGSMSVLLVFLGGTIMAATFLGERHVVRALSRSLIAQTIDQTVARLQRFVDPVTANLLLLQSWGNAGLLAGEAETLNRLLVPAMRPYPQLSAFLVADRRGRQYMLQRIGDRWSSRETRRDAWGARARWLEWTDREPTAVVSWHEIEYDPRTRPWYLGAVARGQAAVAGRPDGIPALVHWTEPYTFFTLKAPGMTASVTFDPGTRGEYVVGVDVLLNDISEFTTSLRPSQHGEVIILSDGDRVIGLPADPRFADPMARQPALLKRPDELGITVIVDAMRSLRGAAVRSARPARFLSEGQPWWGEVRPFDLGSEHMLSVAVVVPEGDLLGGLASIRKWILLLTGAALGLAMAWAAVLAGRYGRPIEALVRESDRISRGDLERGALVQSTVAEVQHLAHAHERMRLALRTLLRMERDLQLARQIQQSTLPERLPVLREFELDAWCEPAEATGGDTYDVVGIGATDSDAVFSDPAAHVLFLLADAAGHGIGPALSVTQVRAMLRMAVGSGEDLSSIVQRMNAQLSVDFRDGHFVSAWLGLLDVRGHSLTSVSCGQGPIIYYTAERRECELLAADTVPLGIFEKIDTEPLRPRTLAPGDIMVVMSDGILEAQNENGEQFGIERIRSVIRENHDGSGPEILTALRRTVTAFTDGAPAGDDRTVIVIKRKG